MRFSVLIPVYNVEKYLNECLDSVFSQDFDDYEVIIVDDGSTDAGDEICDVFLKKYPQKTIVVHKENQGLISARRKAISLASGEYCVFVDSDDAVKKDLLSVVQGYLVRFGEPDIVMYSFQYLRDGKPAEQYPHSFPDGKVWEGEDKKELYTALISGSGIDALVIKAIKTSILKDDPIPYENYYTRNMSEDTLQSIYPLTAAKRIVFAKKTLYLYRIIETSISHNFSISSIEKKNTNHVYYTLFEYLSKWGMDSEDYRLLLEARWFNEAMYTFSKHYEAAHNKKERAAVLNYNWDNMIPMRTWSLDNTYISQSYRNLYKEYKRKEYWRIRLLFARKHAYSLWKKIKKERKSSVF